MQIDNIRIRIVTPKDAKGLLRAYAVLCVAGGGLSLVVNTIRIVRGGDGKLIVAWPSRRARGIPPRDGVKTHVDAEGCYYNVDTTHPADAATREYFDRAVLRAYRMAILARQEHYEYRPSDVTRPVAAIAV